jgi:hypothetical protein
MPSRPGDHAVNGYLLMLCCEMDDLPVRFFATREEALDYAYVNGPRIGCLADSSAARLQRDSPDELRCWVLQPFTNGEPGVALTFDFDLDDLPNGPLSSS